MPSSNDYLDGLSKAVLCSMCGGETYELTNGNFMCVDCAAEINPFTGEIFWRDLGGESQGVE